MKTEAIFLCSLLFFSCAMSVFGVVTSTECGVWNYVPMRHKEFPCDWTDLISANLFGFANKSAMYVCHNVPITATLDYTVVKNPSDTSLPFSVSLWAVDEAYNPATTPQAVMEHYTAWRETDPLLRTLILTDQCLNPLSCLQNNESTHTSVNLALGVTAGISQTTSYYLFITNEDGIQQAYPDLDENEMEDLSTCLVSVENISFY